MTGLFLTLAGILAAGDDGLREAMRDATTQPAQYLQAHAGTADRLWSSQDAAADPALPWLALVDELIERNRAVELDWKLDDGDIAFYLQDLAGYALLSPSSRAAIAALEREETLTVLWLRDVAAIAAADDVVVAVMDIDSDSYVTQLLRRDDYQRAHDCAERIGQVLRDIREFDPNEG
jgi:hypothetical protein